MLAFLALVAIAPKQAFDIRIAIENIRSAHGLPALGGVVVSIADVPKVVVTGVRYNGAADRVTSRDHWHLGSNTKAMTAALVATFVEKGAFAYSSRLADVLGVDKVDPAYANGTIDDLLRMTAHLNANTGWWDFELMPGSMLEKRRAIAQDVLSKPPTDEFSGSYHYSNCSYVLAALACELSAKKTVEELLEERIFAPLSMQSPAFGPNPENEPWPHIDGVPSEAKPEILDNASVLTAAGRVRLTLKDFGLWIREVMKCVRGDKSLLPAIYGKRLRDAQADDTYFDGWIKCVRNWSKGPIYTHAGTNGVNYSVVWLAPTEGIGYAAVTNDGGKGASTACDEFVSTMIVNRLR